MSKPNKAKRDRYHKAHPERGTKTARIKEGHGQRSKFSKK
jgi:hypothetical protein